jgi:nardilysin
MSTPDATDNVEPSTPSIDIQVGPDLNASRSPFDKKEYRQIMLPNGLRVVLICDVVAMRQSHNLGGIFISQDGEESSEEEEEEKPTDVAKKNDVESDGDEEEEEESEEDGGIRQAAAAMVVGVGTLSDPPECQGMAHFLEHLLFMGSEKYPDENAYDSFLSKRGGSDNAFTEMEYTVYHFDIPQDYLFSALDMFSGFFTNPLMLETSVERELNSIESEFQLVKSSDHSRGQQLMCHTSGHDVTSHPITKFSWGNLQSLKVRVRAGRVFLGEKLVSPFCLKKYLTRLPSMLLIQEYPKANNVDTMALLRTFYNQVSVWQRNNDCCWTLFA